MMRPASAAATAVLLVALATPALAIDNGAGLTPPMGWRSWNLYASHVNQSVMLAAMDGIASRKRLVDGVPTSLADLGYADVGLDDNWQRCGVYGSENYTYHAAGGVYPVVNHSVFPDMLAMTSYAHSLNLTAGWYLNNCICSDSCGSNQDKNETDESCYRGDVAALFSFGFDSVKLDGCGRQRDLDLWASLLNASADGPIVIENCHWGGTVPTADWCPFNFFRTSNDIRANYASVLTNLATTQQFAVANLSRPGCWGYPDMLEVGVGDNMTAAETRSHFAAWAIVSSPLTLSMDVNDDAIMDAVWDLVANPEIIAVNQAWFGHSGSAFKQSEDAVALGSIPPTRHFDAVAAVDAPAWQFLYKPVDATTTAVLLMNSADAAATLTLNFDDVPGFVGTPVAVRDLFARQDLGVVADDSMTLDVAAHDAAFLLLSSGSAAGVPSKATRVAKM